MSLYDSSRSIRMRNVIIDWVSRLVVANWPIECECTKNAKQIFVSQQSYGAAEQEKPKRYPVEICIFLRFCLCSFCCA